MNNVSSLFKEFSDSNPVVFRDENFMSKYAAQGQLVFGGNKVISDFFSAFQGCVFDKGIFRSHTYGSSFIWNKYIGGYFKNYAGKICCFGFDWMGRQFAISLYRLDMIYMFDSATGEVFELQQSLSGFLNEELTSYKAETLSQDFFDNIIDLYGTYLPIDKCFGFKIPLFLGGQDDISNYEVIDMEIYWELNYQLFAKVNNLPEGQLIDGVDIENDE